MPPEGGDLRRTDDLNKDSDFVVKLIFLVDKISEEARSPAKNASSGPINADCGALRISPGVPVPPDPIHPHERAV